jgi:hypothetical protein
MLGAQQRYLFKTLASEPERAREGLAMIGALFQIERTIATAPPPGSRAAGALQTDRRPVLRVVRRGDGLCARRHARNQRDALRCFLDDRRLPLHSAGGRGRAWQRGTASPRTPRSLALLDSTPRRSPRAAARLRPTHEPASASAWCARSSQGAAASPRAAGRNTRRGNPEDVRSRAIDMTRR